MALDVIDNKELVARSLRRTEFQPKLFLEDIPELFLHHRARAGLVGIEREREVEIEEPGEAGLVDNRAIRIDHTRESGKLIEALPADFNRFCQPGCLTARTTTVSALDELPGS
jgi:hypothetical protein